MIIAAVFTCIIIGIADGDTLTARCDVADGKLNLKVRIAEIDAPERGQAWGKRSQQYLAEICHGKSATVRPQTTDRYGRSVARVECDGADASAEQLKAGMAWVFDRYVTDRDLYSLQDEARSARRGLWVDTQPIPPWVWRAQKPKAD